MSEHVKEAALAERAAILTRITQIDSFLATWDRLAPEPTMRRRVRGRPAKIMEAITLALRNSPRPLARREIVAIVSDSIELPKSASNYVGVLMSRSAEVRRRIDKRWELSPTAARPS